MAFADRDELETWMAHYFDSKKRPTYYSQGIEEQPIRWHQVTDNNGDYIFDWSWFTLKKIGLMEGTRNAENFLPFMCTQIRVISQNHIATEIY